MRIIIAMFVLIASTSIFAADSSSGCGFGWQVAPKQSLVSSFTRAAINATFLNSIAMTLGTSGCAQHSIVKNEMKGIHYAEANLDSLVVEMARGNGEFLVGFAEVFGCQNANAFGSMVQNKYQQVVPSSDVNGVELYNNVKKEILNDAVLSKSCSIM